MFHLIKPTISFILILILHHSVFGQTDIEYNSSGKETLFKVVPYDGGGFALYSYETKSTGILRIYNNENEIDVEIPIKEEMVLENNEFMDRMIFGSLVLLTPPLIDEKTKSTVILGFDTKKLNYLCRITDIHGNMNQIDIPNSYNVDMMNTPLSGYFIDDFGNFNMLFSTQKLIGKNKITLVKIDLINLKCSRIEINEDDLDEHFNLASFIGSKNNELVYLSRDINDHSQSELLFINHHGAIRKVKIELPSFLNGKRNVVNQIKSISQIDNNLYFAMNEVEMTSNSINIMLDYVIFKISDESTVEYTKWSPSEELFPLLKEQYEKNTIQREAVHNYITMYSNNKESYLMFSFKGQNLVVFKMDDEDFKVNENVETEYYPTVDAPTTLDLVVYVEEPEFFKLISEDNAKCNQWNADCLVNIRTIKNADDSFGYIVITGNKVKGEKYFENIEIKRY